MLENILVPLDGSESAEIALPYATLLAARCGATLTLLLLGRNDDGFSTIDGQGYLEQLRTILSVNMIMFETENYQPFRIRLMVAKGDYAKQTFDAALETEADLMIVSSHRSKSRLQHLKEINLVEKVSREALVPMMLVNPSLEKHYKFNLAQALHQPERYDLYGKLMVVPLDGTLEAEAIFKMILPLAHTLAAPLTLLRVTESRTQLIEKMGPIVSNDALFWESMDETLAAQVAEAREYLNNLKTRISLANYPITRRVEQGYPPAIIADYAKQQQAGLIAMASHLYPAPEGFFLGSVAREVIEESTTPLLVIKRRSDTIKEEAAS